MGILAEWVAEVYASHSHAAKFALAATQPSSTHRGRRDVVHPLPENAAAALRRGAIGQTLCSKIPSPR